MSELVEQQLTFDFNPETFNARGLAIMLVELAEQVRVEAADCQTFDVDLYLADTFGADTDTSFIKEQLGIIEKSRTKHARRYSDEATVKALVTNDLTFKFETAQRFLANSY